MMNLFKYFKNAFSISLFLLIPTFLLLVKPNFSIAQTWKKNGTNPLFSTVGARGTWNGVGSPFVLGHAIEDSGEYKLYISGCDGFHHHIGLVTSRNLESGWTYHNQNPVLTIGTPGAWDDDQVFGAMVIKDGDTYKMWYSGEGSGIPEVPLGIGYATSPDGINWNKDSRNNPVLRPEPDTWESLEVFAPYVIKTDSNTFQMWYTGNDGNVERIGYATSSDGINWQKCRENPVLDIGPESSVLVPTLLKRGGDFGMWYIDESINFAASEDGIHWYKDPANPALSPGKEGQWDDDTIIPLQVLKTDTLYHMLYFGTDMENQFGVGLATLEGLEKIPPDLEVLPDWFHENLTTGEEITRRLTITNQGEEPLSFDFWCKRSPGIEGDNYALSFDGEDDHVAINVPGVYAEITISMWVYLGTARKTYYTLLRSEQPQPDGATPIIFLEDRILKFELDYKTDEFILESTGSINRGEWTHVAATYDHPNRTARIYLNGKLCGEKGGTPAVAEIGNALIGGINEWGGWNFNGLIDEVRIWNTVRTEKEINDAMRHEISGKDENLLGYWRFNDGENRIAKDETMNHHDGTLINGADWEWEAAPIFPPWLMVSPLSGNVSAESSRDVAVIMDATDIAEDLVSCDIILYSNDPYEPVLMIPVEIQVQITDIAETNYKNSNLPLNYQLLPNFPNPFNPGTTFFYELPKDGQVKLSVYNVTGQMVAILVDSYKEAGYHSVKWIPDGIGTGLYFYRIESGTFSAVKKCIVMK